MDGGEEGESKSLKTFFFCQRNTLFKLSNMKQTMLFSKKNHKLNWKRDIKPSGKCFQLFAY